MKRGIAVDKTNQNKSPKSKSKLVWSALSAGTLAGALSLLISSPDQVHAQVASNDTTTPILEEVKSLYNEFKQLKNNKVTESENTESEIVAETPEVIEENDEIKAVKKLLLQAIKNAGGEGLVEQIDEETVSVDDLEALFEYLIQHLTENSSKPGEISAFDGFGVIEMDDSLPEEGEEISSETSLESEKIVKAENEEIAKDVQPEVEIANGVQPESEIADDKQPEVEISNTVESDKNEENIATKEISDEKDTAETKSTEIAEPSSEVKAKEQSVVKNEKIAVRSVAYSAPQSNKEQTIVHIVRPGDTLNKLARQYQTTVARLASLNNITNINLIRVGQALFINGKNSQSAQKAIAGVNQVAQITNRDQFIQAVGEAAREVANEYNLYASVMVAQAALESGYGRSGLSLPPNHNLFGIKGHYNGQSVKMPTSEYSRDRGWYRINADFRKYPSYRESLVDNAKLLRGGTAWNPRFYAGAWKENAGSYQEATQWLQGRYATDPSYASKLNNIIRLYNLAQYDNPKANVSTQPKIEIGRVNKPQANPTNNAQATPASKPAPKPAVKPAPQVKNNAGQYVIQSGDTLSKIARQFNTSVSALKSANGLKSDLIITGHRLLIPGVQAQVSKPAVKPTVKPAPQVQNNAGRYVIQSGDTLSKIARQFNTSVSALKSANGLKSDLIITGHRLLIPGAQTQVSKPAPKPVVRVANVATQTRSNAKNYVVQSGDTLSGIARKMGTTVDQLVKLNGIRNKNIIYVGQTLAINSYAPAQAQTKASAYAKSGQYTVKRGDSLYKIARQYGKSVQDIARQNNLKNPNLIYPGQVLKV